MKPMSTHDDVVVVRITQSKLRELDDLLCEQGAGVEQFFDTDQAIVASIRDVNALIDEEAVS